jgi:hypothetical protein
MNVHQKKTGFVPVSLSRGTRQVLKLTLAVIAIFVCSTGVSAQRFAILSGNWTDPIWATTAGGVAGSAATPTSADAVTINVGKIITINTAAACASFTMTGASASASTVSISGTNSLSCTGAFSMPVPATNTTNTFNVGAGTLTVGGTTTLNTQSNISAAVSKLTLTTGTINFNGAVSLNARSTILSNAVIDLTGGAGTVNFGFAGTVFSTVLGTLTPGTSSTCVYNNAGAQTIGAFTYYNLTTSGGGTKTTAGIVGVNGDLTVNSGTTFATGATNTWTLSVSGTTNVSGTLTLANTGAKTFSGDINVNGSSTVSVSGASTNLSIAGDLVVNGTWNETAAAVFSLAGNLQNNATFTASTGVHTFSGTSKTISGTVSIPSMAVTGSYQNDGTLTVSTALSGAGSLTNAANKTLNITGTSTITTLTATASGNTVVYNGGAQTIKVTTYDDLTLSGSNTKTVGAITVNGDLTLAGTANASFTGALTLTGSVFLGSGTTFTGGAFTHNISGNWNNNGGTFTSTGTTINFNNTSAAQAIQGSAASQTFNSITIAKTAQALSVSGSTTTLTIGGTLTLTSGIFDLGSTTNCNVVNWTNNGGTLTGGTKVTFTATGSVGGSSSTTFPDLTIGAAAAMTTTLNADVQCTNLSINPNNAGQAMTLAVGAQDLTVTGTATLSATNTQTLSVSTGNVHFTRVAGITWAGGTLSLTGNGTVSFTGPVTQSLGTIQNTTAAGTISFNGGYAKSGGTFTTLANETINIGGDLTVTTAAVTFIAGSKTVFTGNSTVTPTAAITFDSVRIESAAVTFAGNIQVNGSWVNNGGSLSGGSTTVTLSDASGIIDGTSSTSFPNLVIAVGSAFTMNNNNSCSSLTIGATTNATATSFTQATGTTLTVNNAVTINQPTGNTVTNAWNINEGIATVSGLITFAGSNTTVSRIGKIVLVTNGILNANAGITFTTGAAACHVIDMSGGGTVNLKGAFTGGATGGTLTTATSPSSTFNYYDGGAAQTINVTIAGAYNNLKINNTHSSGASLATAITAADVTGNITVGDELSGSLFDASSFAITLGNSKTLTIAANSTMSMSGAATSVTFGTSGNAVINGTFKTANTSGFSGAAGTAISVTNTPAITLGPASTIEYTSGSAQAVTARTDYANVAFSGAGTKTIPTGTTTLSGNISGSGPVTASAATIVNIAGNWTYNGTFTASTSTVNFNGSGSAQSFTPASGASFNIVKSNNASGVNLGVAVTIATLTIGDVTSNSIFRDNGNQVTGTGTLTLSNSGTLVLGAGTATTFPAFSSVSLTSGTVEYASSVSQTIAAKSYGNLTSSSSGARVLASSGTIAISGTFTPGSNTYTSTGSTVDFNGSTQSVPAITSYNNLTLSTSGPKTAAAALTVNGTLTIASGIIMDMSTFALSGASMLTSGTGTLKTSNTGTTPIPTGRTWSVAVEFASSSGQSVPAGTYDAFTISGGNLKTQKGDVTIGNNGGTLTLTAGVILMFDGGSNYNLTIKSSSISTTSGSIDASGSGVLAFANTSPLTLTAGTISNGPTNLTVSGGSSVTLGASTGVLSVSSILSLTNSSKLGIGSGNILDISGTVSGNGFITGNTNATLTVSGNAAVGTMNFDQASSGSTNALLNFTINSTTGSLTLGNTLRIVGTLRPPTSAGSFTFNTGANLVITSSLTGSGRIDKVFSGFSFNGNASIERFVRSKTARRYVLLASPVDGISIRNAWQDDIFITAPGSGGTTCGIGTGNGGGTDRYNSNGYDVTFSNLYTLFTYDQTTAAKWVNVGTNTTTTTLTKGIGYRVYYRGSRGANDANCSSILDSGSPMAPDATTMNVLGAITTGDVSVNVYGKGTGTFGYTLLGNPYPCELDWSKFVAAANSVTTKITATYYTHDPNSTSTTGYLSYNNGTVTGGGSNQYSSGTITGANGNQIASGQAFLVQSPLAGNANAGTLTFTEDQKSTTQQLGVFRPAGINSAWDNMIRVKFTQADSTYIDDIVIRFSDDPTVTTAPSDYWDAITINSGNFIAGIKNNRSFAIQTRPLNFYNDTVLVRIVSATTGNFRLYLNEFENFTAATQIILLDLFTGTQTDVKANPYYNFTITSDPASQAGRFKLVFRSSTSVLPVSFMTISATQKQQGVEVAWKLAFEQNIDAYTIERSENGRTFAAIGTVKSRGNSSTPVDYLFQDTKPVTGTVYYRVKSTDVSGDVKYSAVVKINAVKESLISFYPNPVKDQLKLITANLSLDKASVVVRNAQGKVILQQLLSGTTGNYSLDVSRLASGMYFITVVMVNGDRIPDKFIKY